MNGNAHAVSLIEIRLGERWQPISNQSIVSPSSVKLMSTSGDFMGCLSPFVPICCKF